MFDVDIANLLESATTATYTLAFYRDTTSSASNPDETIRCTSDSTLLYCKYDSSKGRFTMNTATSLEGSKIETITTIFVQCSAPLEVGQTLDGYLRVIPIVGGTFSGKISGEVVPGGADWSLQKEDDIGHVHAKYTLRTDDGALIMIENEGYIQWKDFGRAAKTTPRFACDVNGPYAWLNHGVYTGGLQPGETEGSIIITIYRLP